MEAIFSRYVSEGRGLAERSLYSVRGPLLAVDLRCIRLPFQNLTLYSRTTPLGRARVFQVESSNWSHSQSTQSIDV